MMKVFYLKLLSQFKVVKEFQTPPFHQIRNRNLNNLDIYMSFLAWTNPKKGRKQSTTKAKEEEMLLNRLNVDYLGRNSICKIVDSTKKQFVCGQLNCGKRYAELNDLNNHKKSHTGEKPFVYYNTGSGKRFGYESSLTYHNRIFIR